MSFLKRNDEPKGYPSESGIVDLQGYEPSDKAILDVARNTERSFVKLNRDATRLQAATNLAMREIMAITATTACASHFSQIAPEASARLNAVAEEHSRVAMDILHGWRRKKHD